MISEQHEQIQTKMNELYTALCKAQGELNPAEKDSIAGAGSFKYKYANLSAVMGAAQDALTNNGLSFTTRVVTEDHITVFYARLAHTSGQYLESKIEIGINLNDIKAIQELGKAITYLRRYTFSMMVGVVTEEDDDAQSLVKSPQKLATPRTDDAKISHDQLDTLEHELVDHQDIAQAIISKYGTLSNIPKNQFYATLDRIREIKRLKEQKK
jgi:hypothetical protein